MVGHGQCIPGDLVHRERAVGVDRLAVAAAVQERVAERVPVQVFAHRVETRPVAEPVVEQEGSLGAGAHDVVRNDLSCHNIPCSSGGRVLPAVTGDQVL